MLPNENIENLDGIGPKRAKLLAKLGIETMRDMLFHFPRDYQDRRTIANISDIETGDFVTIEAEVVKARMIRLRGRQSLAVATLSDGTGEINATWFGRGFLARTFKPGYRALFTGNVGTYNGLALKNPDYEPLSCDDEDHLNTGRIVPIYPLTEKVSQRMLRRCVRQLLDQTADGISETLSAELLERYKFPPLSTAIAQIHFPDELDDAKEARRRFAYEEILRIQLGVLGQRAARHAESDAIRHKTNGPILKSFRDSLPFKLTRDQKKVIRDILKDMRAPYPMMRLLQGDVGCGKTIVALHAVACAADGGHQTAIMAPTEILAEQHYISLRDMLQPLRLNVASLTGSTRDAAGLRQRIESGEIDVVVGTHALIQEKSAFHNLGLVIIDEQHRFGVMQREALVKKGPYPDILHMTATPIPRTLSITVYGGMDISVIEEMPPGRLPVKTSAIPESKVEDLYEYVREQAQQGKQTYIICPLVEESDKRDLRAVTTHFDELSTGVFSNLRTALIHGRMQSDEKDTIMHSFKNCELDVLFSTSVIEVGIDVPTASVIVIEDASQFGLTQLHQLRGRVGRGNEQAYCFLLGKPITKDGKKRIEVLCATNSGFDIAEEDLKLRGPGEFYGVRQAGLSDLRAADLIQDVRLIEAARRDAQEMLAKDPSLAKKERMEFAL